MTEGNMDSGQPSGTLEQPTQDVSGGAGDQPHSSVDAKAFETALRELQGQVRALQSDKDRGVHEVKSQIKDLMKQFEWVKKAEARGLSPEEIEEQLELKALLAERRRGASPDSSPDDAVGKNADGNRAQAASVDANAILSPLGLQANDPEVIAILREKDFTAQLAKLAELSGNRKAQEQAKRAPNPAQVLPVGGGQSVQAEDLESLTAELAKEMGAPSPNMNRVRELSKKQAALLPKR